MYSSSTIGQAFESFRGKRVLVIGDVMIDAYLWGRVERISPEAPVPIVSLHKRENRLGGAANVALNIRNLGGIPVLCTFTGDDEKGRLFNTLSEENGLVTSGVIPSGDRMTTVKFRIIGNNTQMLRVDEETENPLTGDQTSRLLEKISGFLENRQTDAIVFEDYDKGVISPALIREVTGMAYRQGIPVAADPKRKNFLAYKGVTLFKPNLKELREGLKLDDPLAGNEEIRKAAIELQEKLQAGIIMTTLGSKGIFFRSADGPDGPMEGFVKGFARDISDVSGAGDTVISLAALGLAGGLEVGLMAALCNLGGGLVCEHVGVVPVNRETLMAEALKHLCGN
jgi:D-glycero-beta-D-manno-heptose-7-phosphate kinase